MSKHMVVCMNCGRRFDASRGGYYFKTSRRYMCPKCGKEHNREVKEAQADEREARTGMRQSTGAMIAKIAVGLLFVVSSFATDSVGATLTGIVIGLALVAWGMLPWWKIKKAELDAKKAEAADAAVAEAARLAEPWTCPACGADTKGDACEYCGRPRP